MPHLRYRTYYHYPGVTVPVTWIGPDGQPFPYSSPLVQFTLHTFYPHGWDLWLQPPIPYTHTFTFTYSLPPFPTTTTTIPDGSRWLIPVTGRLHTHHRFTFYTHTTHTTHARGPHPHLHTRFYFTVSSDLPTCHTLPARPSYHHYTPPHTPYCGSLRSL